MDKNMYVQDVYWLPLDHPLRDQESHSQSGTFYTMNQTCNFFICIDSERKGEDRNIDERD